MKKRFKSRVLAEAIYNPNQPSRSGRLDSVSYVESVCTADPEKQIGLDEFKRKNKKGAILNG